MEEDVMLDMPYNNLGDTTLNKLILLHLFDKMEVAMTENTVFDICSGTNNWIPYMDLKPVLPELIDSGFIFEIKSTHSSSFFTITPEGRACLSHFFSRIPLSLRDTITAFVKENRLRFRRKQEYDANYFKNEDGTYTLSLKIIDMVKVVLKLEFTVASKDVAKQIYRNWEHKAPEVYASIHETLME